MSRESIFSKLDADAPKDELKGFLRDYLVKQIERQKQHPEDSEIIAYEIAGLLSTDFARSLEEGDPYLQILALAGNLELPEHHRGNAAWEDLEILVRALPKGE